MAFNIKDKKKIALVLSGGGIKAAAFHIGVCLALKEKGFRFAGGTKDQVRRAYSEDEQMTIRSYVGSSAGAFVAAILSSGHSLESLVNAFDVGVGRKPHYEDYEWDKLRPITYGDIFSLNGEGLLKSIPRALFKKSMISGGIESFIKDKFKINGFFTTENLERYLREYALSHNSFSQIGVDLFIVGTQLNHTRKVIFGNFKENLKTDRVKHINYAKISEAVAASASLPPVFSPYSIRNPENQKDMYFFDGEIRDTLSTHIAVDHGADLVISSYSVHPYHYSPELGSLHEYGIPVIVNQALYQVIQQKIDRHITHQQDIRSIYNAIDGYFKQNKLSDEHREKVLEIVRNRVRYRPDAEYVYVHPRPHDHEMFFADHFSLNPKILERIVKIGFRSAISSLRKLNL